MKAADDAVVIKIRKKIIVFFLNVLSLIKKRLEMKCQLVSLTGTVSGKTFMKYPMAMAFIGWVTSPQGQQIIKEFGIDKFGTPLFYPQVIK